MRYTRVIDPDMERRSIELSVRKEIPAAQLLAQAQNSVPEELIALAEEMGLDLSQFEIQERQEDFR